MSSLTTERGHRLVGWLEGFIEPVEQHPVECYCACGFEVRGDTLVDARELFMAHVKEGEEDA